MIVTRTYGVLSDNGTEQVKVQMVAQSIQHPQWIAIVSYKNGEMTGCSCLSKDEAKKVRDLIHKYFHDGQLREDVIHTLTTTPANDLNYKSVLKDATKEELEEAIAIMKKGGKHKQRISSCKAALSNYRAKNYKPEPSKPKIVEFPKEKPKIIPLPVTNGAAAYDECLAKINKEAEMFSDEECKYVMNGLLEMCKTDQNFRNNFMRKDKSFGGFMDYMYEAARKGYCIKYGNTGWLGRDAALGVALDYYNNDQEKQDAIKKAEEEAKKKQREAERKEREQKRKEEQKKKQEKAKEKADGGSTQDREEKESVTA